MSTHLLRPPSHSSVPRHLANLICALCWLNVPATQATSWTVFRPFSFATVTIGSNLVLNPDMETPGSTTPLHAWNRYLLGYTSTTATAHSPIQSLQCYAPTTGLSYGAYQHIVLNQSSPRSLFLSAWSKAQDVTGSPNNDYSVYLDLYYTNGQPLYGQTLPFATGSHDWQYLQRLVVPAQPVKDLYCYLLFRNSHTGTVWFDDITIAEIAESVATFDGIDVLYTRPDPPPFTTTSNFVLNTGDGLLLQLAAHGGVISALTIDNHNHYAPESDYASGWLLCDRRVTSAWWNVGGTVSFHNNAWVQQSLVTDLQLTAEIHYRISNNAIRITALVSNTAPGDRAISLYFALPADFVGGLWHATPRSAQLIGPAAEYQELGSQHFGARDALSVFPLASVTRESGLTLAIPPDAYRPYRLIYNRLLKLFFAAFDLGLSPRTQRFPNSASVELCLFRSDPAWGLRAGLDGLYHRFPLAFQRRFTNEGIWVAFADLSPITNLHDFHIAYHETSSSSHWKFDDLHNIPSYRYLTEPWSFWMSMPTNIPNNSYPDVLNYLLHIHTNGTPTQRAYAEATLSSGIRNKSGLLQFQPAAAPWCPYGAVFSLYASPFINDPTYPRTKFSISWNDDAKAVYTNLALGQLDGDYIDSYMALAATPNYHTNHLRTTSLPLTFRKNDFTLMLPLIYGTYELCRAVRAELDTLGKPLIANGVYVWPRLPIGLELFDHAGTEINLFDSAGEFIQPSDYVLTYMRALSAQRPYGFLLNTDFSKVSHLEMETYMRVCAVYGIYPSAFSHNAAEGNYFLTPELYERDRPLFKTYIPLIKDMNARGWQPITHAVSSTNLVALERFGLSAVGSHAYLSVRNLSPSALVSRVSFHPHAWAGSLPYLTLTNLFGNHAHTLDLASGQISLDLALQPYECRVYRIIAFPEASPCLFLLLLTSFPIRRPITKILQTHLPTTPP
ncbi:MAG: hypothetical protein N2595_00235 [bacterium]|nr:hypothetical protein [bacterium]